MWGLNLWPWHWVTCSFYWASKAPLIYYLLKHFPSLAFSKRGTGINSYQLLKLKTKKLSLMIPFVSRSNIGMSLLLLPNRSKIYSLLAISIFSTKNPSHHYHVEHSHISTGYPAPMFSHFNSFSPEQPMIFKQTNKQKNRSGYFPLKQFNGFLYST